MTLFIWFSVSYCIAALNLDLPFADPMNVTYSNQTLFYIFNLSNKKTSLNLPDLIPLFPPNENQQ
jgi:hypothetical protein